MIFACREVDVRMAALAGELVGHFSPVVALWGTGIRIAIVTFAAGRAPVLWRKMQMAVVHPVMEHFEFSCRMDTVNHEGELTFKTSIGSDIFVKDVAVVAENAQPRIHPAAAVHGETAMALVAGVDIDDNALDGDSRPVGDEIQNPVGRPEAGKVARAGGVIAAHLDGQAGGGGGVVVRL